MDWSDLKIFLAVAQAGTLGGAAKLTGQTQPTMGRRIRALEQAVGHSLFQRTSDGFVLTDEGLSVIRYAERIEQEAIAIERQLAGQGQQLDGMLRVASFDWFGAYMLTEVFAPFVVQHPRVTIELITDPRLLSLVRREADLAFRILPFDEPDIIQRKLMHVDYSVYGPVGMASPKLGDGAGLSLVTMNTAYDDLPDVTWLQSSLPNAHIAFRSNSREAQAQMCAAGAGIAVLPDPLGQRTPGIARLDLGEAPPGRSIWVGYHRDLKRLARLRALLDATINRFAN